MNRLLAVVLLTVTSSAAHASIVNGSLTGPVRNGAFDPPGVPTGWSMLVQSPDTNDVNNNVGGESLFAIAPSGPSPDGGTWVSMAAYDLLGLYESFGQTVTGLTVGVSYDLTWYAANFGASNGIEIAADPNAIEVLVDSNSIGSGGLLALGENWFEQSLSFTATSTSLDLEFRPLNIVDSYIAIDGIALTPTVIPIPAAAWLFSSALMGLGWMRRKAR